jgi:hypothetical protein
MTNTWRRCNDGSLGRPVARSETEGKVNLLSSSQKWTLNSGTMTPLRVTMHMSMDGMFVGCTSIQFAWTAIIFWEWWAERMFNGTLSCTRRKYVINSTISCNLIPHVVPQYTNNRHFNTSNTVHLPLDLPSKIFDTFNTTKKSEFQLLWLYAASFSSPVNRATNQKLHHLWCSLLFLTIFYKTFVLILSLLQQSLSLYTPYASPRLSGTIITAT